MKNEHEEILLSQLVDGELESDRGNEVLLDVLDDAQATEKLKQMLRLRQATSGWRSARPRGAIVVTSDRTSGARRGFWARRAGHLVAGALVGGLLVLAAFWAAGRNSNGQNGGGHDQEGSVASITPEQMQEIAQVFALHESVAGPLKWYAADETQVRLAPADPTLPRAEPVAVVLHFWRPSNAAGSKSVVVVCRESEQATVELPPAQSGFPGVRIRLLPRRRDGRVDLRYALAVVQPDGQESTFASLAGDRTLGLDGAALGQLALKDGLFNVEANSWVLPEPSQ